MKKGYNPFKMWGSYAGAVIGTISYFLLTTNTWDFSIIFSSPQFLGVILLIISGVFIGSFFVGWGVHSLIRGLKNAF